MKIICCPKISSIGQETKRKSQFEVGCYGWIFDCEFLSFFSLLAAEKLSLKNLKIRPKIGLYLPHKNGLMDKNGLVQIGLLFIHIGREKKTHNPTVLRCVLLIPWISRYQQINGFNEDPITPQNLFFTSFPPQQWRQDIFVK